MCVVLAWAVAATGAAAAPPESGTVRAVVDGDTVVLEGGTQVRLVGIQAPKLALGRRGFKPWPLGVEAKATLESMVLGRMVALSYGGREVDRHGRLLAHIERPADGGGAALWAQGEMLRRGLARVYTFADNRWRAAEMLAAERAARAARRGIWRLPFYRILAPEEAARRIDTFQLVEGVVLKAAVVRGRGYLNFGPDWRSDFTISIAPRNRRAFAKAGLDIAALGGRRVRVRGWLRSVNGPMIEATHPEQIEVLGE